MSRLRRIAGVCATTVAMVAAGMAITTPSQASEPAAAAQHAHRYTAPSSVKINVMGEWAHPDDDTGIIGPCGVWHQKYGVRCGVIQITRGEGGGNAVGDETGPALGLRRENEDRIAHYRSGTVDIFYLDRSDFFYNQSAPLTNYFWNHDETLRRVTRIIRTTQPDIYIGWTPTLDAGHGNHQEAGRMIWEGMLAAADPTMFPDQLTGPDALSTWQVKKIFSSYPPAQGTGGTDTAPNCTTGFRPQGLNTVGGVWTGYDSPYSWPAGNIQGQPAGSPKIWAQVASEGRMAYPTQSRVMYQDVAPPRCVRFVMTYSTVPFQPNVAPDGSLDPDAGRDDAMLYGATRPDPGGLPLGTEEYLTFSRFYNVPGVPFQATVHVTSPRHLASGTVSLHVPQGWSTDGPQRIGSVHRNGEATATFTVTPGADAPLEQNAKISATYRTGHRSGYTDEIVHVVPPVEGRFHRWGKWQEYDNWLQNTAPEARKLGRSDAVQPIGIGETVTVPVDVTNRSDTTQSGTVRLDVPQGFSVEPATAQYTDLAAGDQTTVRFQLTNTQQSLPRQQQVDATVITSYGDPAGQASETLHLSVVPTTAIPQASSKPSVDAQASPGEYPGATLDIGRVWQGSSECTGAADCGESGTGDADHDIAKVSWYDDALYFYVHVRDDYQSYAVTPKQCVAHWLADSVEIQIDPRGNSSQDAMDTATTFKLGVFPYTDDPDNTNGNGVNGPCWERDADNHQGYSTGPLAQTVPQAPNAPGVQVASSASWVGSNDTTVDHAYAGGGYDLEVKVPMADLPAAVDPSHMGLNITPYDNDNTAAAGTTTLRHIDNSTRLGWSAFGSVQSDPYRWGDATVTGYTPPPDRSTTPSAPILNHQALDGTTSPQTIAQSARNGVPIAGRNPAPRNDRIVHVGMIKRTPHAAWLWMVANGPGTAQVYLWSGRVAYIPVYQTSCSRAADPPPDYGFTPCAVTDGGTPAWEPDMSGHLVAHTTVTVHPGIRVVRIPLTPQQSRRLADNGRALVSFDARAGGVQAFDVTGSHGRSGWPGR